jgi:hypothetical protein
MLMSFYHIYFCGTFVIFSSVIGRKGFGDGVGKGSWIFTAWQSLGSADKRYLETDVYLNCLNGVLALVVSPLLLFFAWSTFVRAPYRHLPGIIASSMMVYTAIIYFGVEMMPWSNNFNFKSNPGGVTALIVLELIFEFFLPLLIIYREVVGNMKGISRADTQQLLLLMNKNIIKDDPAVDSAHAGTYLNTTESDHNSQLYTNKSKSRSSSVTSTKSQSIQSLNSRGILDYIPERKAQQSERRVNFDHYNNNEIDDEEGKSSSRLNTPHYLQHRPIDIHARQRKGSAVTEVEVEVMGREEGSYFSPSRFMDDSSDSIDHEAGRKNQGSRRRKRTESKAIFNGSSHIPGRKLSGPPTQTQTKTSQSLDPPERKTTVTPEALIAALTMSMADNASSLAMVV